ncbi:MAG: shikimate kinase [Gemmatimonadaceae bacterium]
MLVGLPGSGKTTVGRAAAALAQLPFLDFDEEIERRTGLAPSEFFQRRGESAFRATEVSLSRELVGLHTIVVSPGGGWIAQEAAREALRPHSVLVYLKVTPSEAVRRMGKDLLLRPLLAAGDPLEALTRLLESRESLYGTADHVVDTEAIDLQGVTSQIAGLARSARNADG